MDICEAQGISETFADEGLSGRRRILRNNRPWLLQVCSRILHEFGHSALLSFPCGKQGALPATVVLRSALLDNICLPAKGIDLKVYRELIFFGIYGQFMLNEKHGTKVETNEATQFLMNATFPEYEHNLIRHLSFRQGCVR